MYRNAVGRAEVTGAGIAKNMNVMCLLNLSQRAVSIGFMMKFRFDKGIKDERIGFILWNRRFLSRLGTCRYGNSRFLRDRQRRKGNTAEQLA